MSAGIIYNDGVALTATAAGTLGDVLTSQGSGSAPIFAPGGGGGGSQTPLFFARSTSPQNNVTGDGTVYVIQYDTTDYNVGSCFDTTTGQFTVPATALYRFEMGISVENIDVTNTNFNWYLWDNTPSFSANIFYCATNPYPNLPTTIVLTAFTYLTPSTVPSGHVIDTRLEINGATTNVSIFANTSSNYTWFAAYKLS